MKTATNINPTINYTIIEALEVPTTKIATDADGNKFHVPVSASVGDVLVFLNGTETPVYMRIEDFKIGRTI